MILPEMGEGVIEGTILKWLKEPGDVVAEEESVVEVATDKVTTEIPCAHGGRLRKILAATGEVAKVGAPIALIEVDSLPAKEVVDRPREKEAETKKAPTGRG